MADKLLFFERMKGKRERDIELPDPKKPKTNPDVMKGLSRAVDGFSKVRSLADKSLKKTK